MEFFITTADAGKRSTDCAIVGVYERKLLSAAAAEIDSASGGLISGLMDQDDISCKLGSATVLARVDGARCKRVVVVGLGKKSSFGRREFQRAVRAGLTAIKSQRVVSAVCYLTQEATHNCDAYYRSRLAAQALGEHRYRYTSMKSTGKRPVPKLKKLGLGASSREQGNDLERGAQHGKGIAIGMALTRDLGNTPANICHPTYLADTARELARKHANVSVNVLDEPDMAKLGMHSLLSVGHGSEQPSKLIHLDYRGAGDEPPITLVGKGITFDTGGICCRAGHDGRRCCLATADQSVCHRAERREHAQRSRNPTG